MELLIPRNKQNEEKLLKSTFLKLNIAFYIRSVQPYHSFTVRKIL